jgi:transcriptional repressor NrdR
MICPECGMPGSIVSDSRPAFEDTAVRRRRRCVACGHRWTTYEYSSSAFYPVERRGRKPQSGKDEDVLASMRNGKQRQNLQSGNLD